MGDLSQTVPSQPRISESDLFSKSISPKQKPPLLPKPQFALSNGKYSPVKKVQTSSQTIISVKNARVCDVANKLEHVSVQNETIVLNNKNLVSSDSESINIINLNKTSEKPPALYPKPKLPPKSNAFRTSRINKLTSPSSCENSPLTPEKAIANIPDLTPVRPPRSPRRIIKTNPFNALPDSDLKSEFSFLESRQKSASLPRSEFSNWTFAESDKDSKLGINFIQEPNQSSNHNSVLVQEGISAPTPRPRLKNKPKLHIELDLASSFEDKHCPIYATVDYSKKKNRQTNRYHAEPDPNREKLGSCDSLIDHSFISDASEEKDSFEIIDKCDLNGYPECNAQSSPVFCNTKSDESCLSGDETNTRDANKRENESVTPSGSPLDADRGGEGRLKSCASINNYSPLNSNYSLATCDEPENQTPSIMHAEDEPSYGGEREGIKNSPNPTVPQSFLHRYVGSASKAKEEKPEVNEENQRCNDKMTNSSSFLYKLTFSKKDFNQNSESFEVVTFEDVEDGSATGVGGPSNGALVNNEPLNQAESGKGAGTEPPENRVPGLIISRESDLLSPSSPCNEDSQNLNKRFPWFGSFGKGNKKRAEKKERCSSQFYATPVGLQGNDNINDCTRTKSLPNIKSGEKHIYCDDSYDIGWNKRDTISINSDSSNLNNNSDGDDDKDSVNDADESDKGKKGNKAFLIAKELITSEEVFIDVLRLLNVDFRNYVEIRIKDRNNIIPANVLGKILNHLPELQTLNEVLLSDLKKRIQNWETNPKISDVIVKKGAFLKLYTSYIQDFESQTKYLDDCVVKYPKFGKILKEFESLERCKMLSLKHYMLKPVQRIPQYRLLLSDYLKHIDESSPDYEDTECALKIVCEVADHINRNLKYGDKNGMLMHFQSLLSDYELIKPGRELIKDGPLEKICRKSIKDRYFILLNDCLLHTTYSKSSLKIHQELPLCGMKVSCHDDHKHRYGFTVYSITRSFILCAKSENERNDWVQSLQSAIEQYISRQKTFMNVKIPETDTFKIGKEAPVWIQDNKVTMCQICTTEFTSLFRRHHCRACGKVICKNCGGSQAPLQYDSFKAHRVCDHCFPILLKDYEESEDDIYEILKVNYPGPNQDIQNIYLSNKAKFIKYTSTSKPKFIPLRLKEVSANDAESEMNGLLYRKSRKGWKLYWYVLKEHVLYVYRASEDVKALETVPVLGYEVKMSEVNYENVDKNLIIILEHQHQTPIIFHTDTKDCAERWYKALKRASEFEELGS